MAGRGSRLNGEGNPRSSPPSFGGADYGSCDRPSGKLGGLIHSEASMTLWSITLPIGTVLVLALMDWLYDNR